MAQEEKELLLKDLCARLPYNVIAKVYKKEYCEDVRLSPYNFEDFERWDIKPYLRPMSSMTKEEKEDIKPLFLQVWTDNNKRLLVIRQNKMSEYLNYLYSHHLDFCGLIPMGLALPAPEGMYSIK